MGGLVKQFHRLDGHGLRHFYDLVTFCNAHTWMRPRRISHQGLLSHHTSSGSSGRGEPFSADVCPPWHLTSMYVISSQPASRPANFAEGQKGRRGRGQGAFSPPPIRDSVDHLNNVSKMSRRGIVASPCCYLPIPYTILGRCGLYPTATFYQASSLHLQKMDPLGTVVYV